MNLNEIAEKAYDIARKRQDNGASIKTDTMAMLKHCATEVVEATEAYSLYRDNDTSISAQSNFCSELADVMCCILIVAHGEGVDIERALSDCLDKNRKRAMGIGDKL